MHLYTATAPTHLITLLLALKAPSDLGLLSYTGLEKKQAHFQGHIHKNNTRTHLTPSQTDSQGISFHSSFVCICVHACVRACVRVRVCVCVSELKPGCKCESQMTAYRSQFSPSTMQTPDRKLRWSGLVASIFTHNAILPALTSSILANLYIFILLLGLSLHKIISLICRIKITHKDISLLLNAYRKF